MIKFGEISPLWLSFFAIFYGLFTTWQKFAKTFGGKISVVVVVNKDGWRGMVLGRARSDDKNGEGRNNRWWTTKLAQ